MADRHGPVNELCRDGSVIMAVIAQLRRLGDQVCLAGRPRLPYRVVTVGAVFPRLMYVPERFFRRLGELRRVGIEESVFESFRHRRSDPVKEERHNLITPDPVAAYDKYRNKDR